MKKLELLKSAAGFVVSVGVGAIVGNAVQSTTPDTTGTFKKVCVCVGSFVLASMIKHEAVKYTENKIDDTVVQVKDKVKDQPV